MGEVCFNIMCTNTTIRKSNGYVYVTYIFFFNDNIKEYIVYKQGLEIIKNALHVTISFSLFLPKFTLEHFILSSSCCYVE